jgi:hypothetical protein
VAVVKEEVVIMGPTAIENGWVASAPAASVTLTVKVKLPLTVGIPEMTPAVLIPSPVGMAPEVIDQAKGVVPPIVPTVWLYPMFCMPFGREVVVIPRVSLTVIESGLLSSAPAASVTTTVKGYTPTVVGVPLIAPLEGFRTQPVGRDPDDIDHWYGCVPPAATRLRL